MTEVLQFALLGLGTGAVYALLAQGIVLIFRGSGVINLAHGAFAMLGAYLFNVLHGTNGWPLAPALLVSVAAVAAVGLVTDQALLRRLRQASPLSRLIATVGVLIVLQAFAVLTWGGTPTLVLPIFGVDRVDIFGVVVSTDRIWTLVVCVALAAGLMAVWRFTRAGWVTEAVSENQRGAASLGWSPELVSATTWTVGGALAGVAGILVAPITQLDTANLPLLVIPALAAALIGGFRSFPLTLFGGILLGVAQAEVGNFVHLIGASDGLPLLVIVIMLVVRGSSLPLRGHIFDRLPRVGDGQIDWRVVGPLLVAGVAGLSILGSADWLAAFTATFAIAIILLSLVVLIGYAGQVSLAQYALAGIGALIAARCVVNLDLPFLLAAIAGVVGTALVGLVFALPALRTRGVNLAVVTLALGLATQSLIFNNSFFVDDASGLPVGDQTLFGIGIDPAQHPNRYAILAFFALVVACLAVANLRRGQVGRRLLAVRANERAAAALGINVFGAKLYAFTLASALAGLGGVLFAFMATAVTFGTFSPFGSLHAVSQVVIGGVGYVGGAITGATIAPQSFGSIIALNWQAFDAYLALIGGVGLLAVLIVQPNGIASASTDEGSRGSGLHPHVAMVRLFRRLVPFHPVRREDAAYPAEISPVVPKRLVVENLTVRYGGVVAVDDVSLEVKPGEIVGLIGPNGAGKTSLMDAVTGFTRSTGRVLLDGEAIDRWPAHRRARSGLGRSFQGLELFADLTVRENIQAASDKRDAAALVTDVLRPGRTGLPPHAIAAVRDVGLEEHLDWLPDELSYGQRRLLAIARAVAMEPSVLLLDEPVAGLDDRESAEFAELVRRLARSWGMAVLLIEHDMEFVMGVSDRIVVIDFGMQIAAGAPNEVRNDPVAIAAYLGEDADAAPAHPHPGSTVTS